MRRANPGTRSGALKIFGGSSHPEMIKLIARKVGARVGEVVLGKFANRETHVELKECVRGQDIYVLQTAGGKNPNDSLMELLFLINALRLAAASNIIVITPFFFYSKGDQKDGYRVPITSKLVGTMLKKAGATHLMLLDPHTPQVEGFFDLIIDTLKVEPLFCEWVRHNVPDWEHCVVVSPDEGGAKRSASLANDLILDFAIVSNRNKKFELDSGHLCVHRKRKKKKSFSSDTESVTALQKDSSRSSCLDPNDVTQSSRSSVLDPNDVALSETDREKSEDSHHNDVAKSELDHVHLRERLTLSDRPESDQSVPNGHHLRPSKETQQDCLAKIGGRCYQTQSSSGHSDKDRSRRVHKAIGHLSSPVDGRHVIILDDMIDTGHTIEFALETVQRGGALSVTVLATHGVFSKNALKILESYGDFVRAVVVTNSISQTENVEKGRLKNKFHVLDVSGLIAEFVRRHHYCESVSVLGRFMPIRDSYHGGNKRVHDKKKKEKEQAVELPVAVENDAVIIPALSGAVITPSSSEKDAVVKDDIEEVEDEDDEDDAEDDVDAVLSGEYEIGDDEDDSVSLDDVENARREILDPAKQQKLRKGFRLASVCWDD